MVTPLVGIHGAIFISYTPEIGRNGLKRQFIIPTLAVALHKVITLESRLDNSLNRSVEKKADGTFSQIWIATVPTIQSAQSATHAQTGGGTIRRATEEATIKMIVDTLGQEAEEVDENEDFGKMGKLPTIAVISFSLKDKLISFKASTLKGVSGL